MAGAGAGVGGMVKALMDGNSQYGDDQKKQQMLQQMIASKATPPMTPPVNPQSMPGAAPMMPPQFPQGSAPPVNLDPMTQALFSPIPGVGGR